MVKAVPAYRTLLSLTLGVAILLMNALPLAVHSQSPEGDGTPAVATTTEATTTEAAVTPPPAAANDWFTVEQLQGARIEMGDFVIGPGKVEITIEPGETVVRQISVSNRVSDDRRFDLEVEDVTGTNDGSSAVNLLGSKRGPYSIKEFVSFPDDSFEIGLGERARIPVTVSIPPGTPPGGYYGAVLVSTVRTDEVEAEDGASTVRQPIIARVGSLFFITVPGDVETEGALADFDTIDDNLWYESGPVNFGIVFENTGNIHLNPYGELRITNMLGEEVGFVELDPWFALPNSVRTREVNWDRELLLGRYTATVQVNRGYENIVDEMSISFWVLPWKIMAGIFFAIFIVFFLIRAFFKNFEFKRKGS